jgi:hypothetical protein
LLLLLLVDEFCESNIVVDAVFVGVDVVFVNDSVIDRILFGVDVLLLLTIQTTIVFETSTTTIETVRRRRDRRRRRVQMRWHSLLVWRTRRTEPSTAPIVLAANPFQPVAVRVALVGVVRFGALTTSVVLLARV